VLKQNIGFFFLFCYNYYGDNMSTKKNNSNVFFDKIKKLFNKIKDVVLKFLDRYWQLIVLDIVIFILTVFIESIYIYNLKFLMWVSNTLLFIIIPTIILTLLFKIKSKDIIVSVPIFYVLFLIFLDFCTLRDLYGITTRTHDILPSFIDALLVVFIFTCFEYVTCFITNKVKDKIKKNKKSKK
jgi:hypothetical protein